MIKKLSLLVAMIVAPLTANADLFNRVSCSVVVDVAKPGGTETYQKSFLVQLGVDFFDDFSTPTRFKDFRASTVVNNGKREVSINYYNDVGVFDSIEFSATYALPRNRGEIGKISGSSATYGSTGNYIADYTLTCREVR